MSRWDYDTVFYRVFCVTLLAVAFTFTVILTNVFVDIDGLLSNKDKVKPKPPPKSISHDLSELSRVISSKMLPEDKSEDVYEDQVYQDSNDLYRSKRSLETTNRAFLKDPKVKKLLTNHLASLLDKLDEQNNNTTQKKISAVENNAQKKDNSKIQPGNTNTDKINHQVENSNSNIGMDKNKPKEEIIQYYKDNKDETKNIAAHKFIKDYKSQLLHSEMHNVILQGIIEKTDLDDVYKKVAELVKNFDNDQSKPNKDELRNLFKSVKHFEKNTNHADKKTSLDKFTFIDALSKKDLDSKRNMQPNEEAAIEDIAKQKTTGKPKDVVIKTVIDITAVANDKPNKDNDLNPKDKINGIIKLIYNGNIIKFKRVDDNNNTSSQSFSKKLDIKSTDNTNSKNNNDIGKHPESKLHILRQSYYQKVLNDYLKRFKESDSSEQRKVYSSKRLKRHIKIRFENNKTTIKPKTKKDDDELFVEIETHFDSKGTQGEKKKKLIRNLIEKIQNAIHSDNNTHKKKPKHWNVKKRMQNPLSSKSAAVLLNKLIIPLETLAHRHLDPISKSVPLHEDMPLVSSMLGHNNWDRSHYSPRFLGKSINSAEMNTVDTDYNRVMKHNGIPQRLQKPLNTDMSDEVFQDSKVIDLGNLKFLMKDIDGSGFSIGFNQYTDEAPDPETMKLFSGLENIIQTYHQQYDREPTADIEQQNIYANAKTVLEDDANVNEQQTDNSEQHTIRRRSIQDSEENHYHPNSYKIVYGHNIMPYKKHNDIFDSEESKISKIKKMQVYRMQNAKNSGFIIDEHIFEKDLKPGEILSIADLLQRKKRSIKVKKISNVKIKSKINRYLNTKKMASKSVFMNKKQAKRSKRQIDKIRIIARDLPDHDKSEEDNIFVVSNEKLYADRALVREVELPELEPIDKPHSVEHYDVDSPQKEEEPYDIGSQTQKVNEDPEEPFDFLSPYMYEANPLIDVNHNEFSRRARHNSLMSKYPHIIMEDAERSINHGEEFMLDNVQQQYSAEATTVPAEPIIDIPTPNEQEITDFISPPKDHSNYRVSVKIRPKNTTNMSGFKEVHTSINKSYNKNGLTYTSLVNVSQLSKIENLNKNISRKNNDEHASEQKVNLKQQKELIKTLIQQHKHRLDMQLKHLQIEKQKLETMYNENPENFSEGITEKAQPGNPKKGKKSASQEAKKKINRVTTTAKATTTQTTTTEPTTTVTTTTEYIQTTTDDAIKSKMIETIERNENITNQLLKKIDQNTGVLKIFLGKLISSIDVPSKKSTEVTTLNSGESNNRDRPNNDNDPKPNNAGISTNQPIANRFNIENNHAPLNFDDYHMPHMLFRNMPRQSNNSYGIPFVYAVQHPYGVVPNRDGMASVVYRGHIHTNSLNGNTILKRDKKSAINVVLQDKIRVLTDKKNVETDFWKPKPGEKVLHDFVVKKNNTRFFLDNTQNEFKVVHLSDQVNQVNNMYPGGLNETKV